MLSRAAREPLPVRLVLEDGRREVHDQDDVGRVGGLLGAHGRNAGQPEGADEHEDEHHERSARAADHNPSNLTDAWTIARSSPVPAVACNAPHLAIASAEGTG